jgi:hypothetical protein
MSSDLKDLLQPFLRTQTAFWRRHSLAIVALLAATYLRNSFPHAPMFSIELVPTLEITAAAVVIAAVLYRKHWFSPDRLRGILPREADLSSLATDPKSKAVDPARLARLNRLAASDRKLALLALEGARAATLTAWLANVVVILGFVIAWNVSDALAMAPYVVAALALTYSVCPRLKSLVERAERWDHAVQA